MTARRDDGPRAASTEHLGATLAAIGELGQQLDVLERWAGRVAAVLAGGGRLLAAGNGGSAAEAQHLTAELVGRYRTERRALSAIPLAADAASATAVVNDYGAEQVFARQVEAHGRAGDVLVLLSTSGRSPNVVAAAHAGRRAGLATLALTGPRPNPLADACDEAVAVAAATPAVQEAHLVAVHLLCELVDAALPADAFPKAGPAGIGGEVAAGDAAGVTPREVTVP